MEKITCDICGDEAGHHLPIYITGSEGTNLCPNCNLTIINFVRTLRSTTQRTKLNSWKKAKAKYSGTNSKP